MENKFIPLSVPNFIGNELKYVEETIKTEWVSTAGSYVEKFEKNIAEYTGAKYAVACQSGTAGLHIALIIAGVKAEEEVIVPTLTFIATVNPVKYCNAEPVFMDCDDDLCIDADKLEEFCESMCIYKDGILLNKSTGKRVAAIIYVHIFGNTGNFEKIVDIAEKYNLKLIEDAAESLGTYFTDGRYAGRHTGTIGDIGVYSFNGNKIITTGGGGMIVTNNQEYAKKAKYLTTQAKNDEVRFIHGEVGYNYRMTNMQAALGVAQLEQLEKFIEIKKNNYFFYKEELNKIKGLKIIDFYDKIRANYWFYSVIVDKDNYGLDREELMKKLSENRIQTRPIWYLNHMQEPYKNNIAYKIEKAYYYLEKILNLPCSTNLIKEDLEKVVETIKMCKR